MSRSIREELSFGTVFLRDSGVSSYALDAVVLLCAAANISKTELYASACSGLKDDAAERYRDMLEKRSVQMPVAYIINHCEFMGLDFYVDRHVLIPRPDTEILVEEVIKFICENKKNARVLDMCTGSGCIGISIAQFCPDTSVTVADNSPDALVVARKNAAALGVNDRLKFVCSDMFSRIDGTYDVIVSNPPYIRNDVIPTLPECVRSYEPEPALDGGIDGLDFYRILCRDGGRILNPGGLLCLEIGYDQRAPVIDILTGGFHDAACFSSVSVIRDLAGLDRVVVARM